MSRYITINCDANWCHARTSPDRAVGWVLGDGADLCPNCATGRCNGEHGPYDCSCLLVVNHDGFCACEHDIEPDDPRRYVRAEHQQAQP